MAKIFVCMFVEYNFMTFHSDQPVLMQCNDLLSFSNVIQSRALQVSE